MNKIEVFFSKNFLVFHSCKNKWWLYCNITFTLKGWSFISWVTLWGPFDPLVVVLTNMYIYWFISFYFGHLSLSLSLSLSLHPNSARIANKAQHNEVRQWRGNPPNWPFFFLIDLSYLRWICNILVFLAKLKSSCHTCK